MNSKQKPDSSSRIEDLTGKTADVTENPGAEGTASGRANLHGPDFFWWARQIVFFFLGCFFMIFGILILVSAYSINEPYLFIMTFFASNFIILFSATLAFIFAYRMKPYLVKSRGTPEEQDRRNAD